MDYFCQESIRRLSNDLRLVRVVGTQMAEVRLAPPCRLIFPNHWHVRLQPHHHRAGHHLLARKVLSQKARHRVEQRGQFARGGKQPENSAIREQSIDQIFIFDI